MARLAFCDYHNMIAILEKYEHNIEFHQIVDFVEASHIRYALTINPTVYVSHIRQFWSTVRIETTDEGTKILATVDGKPMTIFESLIRRNLKLNDEEGISSLPDAELFENLALMARKVQVLMSLVAILPLLWEKIIKTSALPYDSTPRVTSPDVDEGSMQHQLQELTDLCTHLQRHQTEMATKTAAQDLEISSVKARIKFLEDKDGGGAEPSGEDATIKGRSLETGEEADVEKSTKRGINDTEELVNVLTSLDAANILTSGVQVVSVCPAAEVSTVSVPTGSGLVPTDSLIFTTASVVTPYSRRKGKEKMVEADRPKKKKLQEQINVQMAREIEEQMAREDQRMDEQIVMDAEIVRIHAEEELQMLIDGLDRGNEVIARHLHEYEQSVADLIIGEKIELINELVKYQDHHAKNLKYQAQQSKPLSKKQQREFYMSVLKSHSGWKTKHFKGMTLEEIREKFIPVWKQIEDFVPMASKEEGERMKRKGLRLEQESAKKMKTSDEVSEEDLKEMMQLVPVEEVYVEALQVKHPIIYWEIDSEGQRNYWKIIRLGGHTAVYQLFVDMVKHFDREDLNQLWTLVKETLSIKQATSDKEKELWVELKRLFEHDFEEHMWTHTQALMHDPLEWKLYDICGVHHIFTKDQEIFMLVENDYPLRRGLTIEGRIVGNKMLKSFSLPVIKMPLLEDFPTAREEMFPLLSQRDAPAEEVCTAERLKVNRGQRHINISQRRVPFILGMCPTIVPII
nr:hypothetical protein [Tanacetum cinerariifolium]